MNNRKKGNSSKPSSAKASSKAGSGKTKPAFAFGKSSAPKGRRSASSEERSAAGGRSRTTDKGPRGKSAGAKGSFNREERKTISDTNFKKRSTGFGKDKPASAARGKAEERSFGAKSSRGPRTARGEEKRSPGFGDKRGRAPKSFSRGPQREEQSRFDEDEFFGRKPVKRTVQEELDARNKPKPKKTAAKKSDEPALSKRAEKALIRGKVDKDFVDIKFNREKEKTKAYRGEAVDKEAVPQDGIRLNRYLSNAGVASRREADQLIQEGMVRVNGKVVTELGTKVKPGDVVKYGSKVVSPERLVYVLLNKPKDFITTTDDPQERKTVMSLVANACKERIVPVGRLDRNTTGLLLFTNDGELAQKLTHPSSKIKKLYLVELNKPIAEKDFDTIKNGKLRLFDGPVKVDDLAVTDQTRKVLGIEIHEGRNRIVRRIFEELGYEVEKLDRVTYAGLTKKDLSRGKWRFLSQQEVNRLKYLE